MAAEKDAGESYFEGGYPTVADRAKAAEKDAGGAKEMCVATWVSTGLRPRSADPVISEC